MLARIPRAVIMSALFGAVLLILGGIIARVGRSAGGAIRAVA